MSSLPTQALSPVVPASADKLWTIEAARGIAALLVAFFHGTHVVELFQPGRGTPFGGLFGFGHAGVPFFFVLSGYIIYYIHRSDLGQPSRLGQFAWKRVTRIYPLFLVVMVPVTAKYLVAGNFEWDYFLKSVLLLPQARLPMLLQSWTLVHEALFYLLFALAIWHVRLSLCILAAWALLFCVSTAFGLDAGSGFQADLLAVLVSPYNLLFLAGMGVAWVLHHRTVRAPRLLALAGATGFLATGLAEDAGIFEHMREEHLLSYVLLYGLSSACIITGLVAAETTGRIRLSRHARLLGSLSYPLYLTHGIAISIFVGLAERAHYTGTGGLLLLCAVMAACVAALAVHYAVEKPVATRLKKLWARRRAAPAFTQASSPVSPSGNVHK